MQANALHGIGQPKGRSESPPNGEDNRAPVEPRPHIVDRCAARKGRGKSDQNGNLQGSCEEGALLGLGAQQLYPPLSQSARYRRCCSRHSLPSAADPRYALDSPYRRPKERGPSWTGCFCRVREQGRPMRGWSGVRRHEDNVIVSPIPIDACDDHPDVAADIAVARVCDPGQIRIGISRSVAFVVLP